MPITEEWGRKTKSSKSQLGTKRGKKINPPDVNTARPICSHLYDPSQVCTLFLCGCYEPGAQGAGPQPGFPSYPEEWKDLCPFWAAFCLNSLCSREQVMSLRAQKCFSQLLSPLLAGRGSICCVPTAGGGGSVCLGILRSGGYCGCRNKHTFFILTKPCVFGSDQRLVWPHSL